jgi:uncharacterized protein YgbK (DUF1537 family)
MNNFSGNTVIVVLDDDPTGTQTVHNIPVVTTWEKSTLDHMFRADYPLFYILTNSRAFSEEVAVSLNEEIGGILKELGQQYDRKILLISRSDSTLRGHFPSEVDALGRGYGYQNPLVFVVPAFIEGGRLTIDGIHYLRQDGVNIPVADTPFAKDPVFGYRHSDLTGWVLEKSEGSLRPDQIRRVSKTDLLGSIQELATEVDGSDCKVVVADADNYEDLTKLSELIMAVFETGREVLVRSAASIVKTLGNLESAPLLEARTLLDPSCTNGGLVVVGSYVPLSTRQVAYLIEHLPLPAFKVSNEVPIDLPALSQKIENQLLAGETVLLYTERDVQTGNSREENIRIGQRYSDLLVEIVSAISSTPAFVVAKGGITSSDIATKGLDIRSAMVKGQLIAGVSVWEPGKDSRLDGFPYVVFPGNVGNDQALFEVVNALTKK